MGREKRIAESRVKQPQADIRKAPEKVGTVPENSAPAYVAPKQEHGTGLGKAIIEIIGLYTIPVIVIILIGKLALHH